MKYFSIAQNITRTAKAVIVEKFDAVDSRFYQMSVPLSHFESFYNESNSTVRVLKVIWGDGAISWAKAWTRQGKLHRLGGGAYGDVTFWRKGDA